MDSQSRVEEIEELFEQNDSDGNGDIDFAEFASLMRDLDDNILQPSLEIGFREIDVNKDGRINLAEFLEWWSEE
jgi:Ca2+-binding EF-hand superfamily protein